MSHAGVIADLVGVGIRDSQVLLIGASVPRIHLARDLPVFVLSEREAGHVVHCRDGKTRRFLVYPSAWPGPGTWNTWRWLHARHEDLPFDEAAALPVFDQR